MKYPYYIIVIASLLIALQSCEKDYIEDVDCVQKGGEIGGWEEHKDTTIIEQKDTTNGSGFYIEVNHWSDTIQTNIPI